MGTYRKRTETVTAERISGYPAPDARGNGGNPKVVKDGKGEERHGYDGDYLVTYADGNQTFFTPAAFEARYCEHDEGDDGRGYQLAAMASKLAALERRQEAYEAAWRNAEERPASSEAPAGDGDAPTAA